ncbi:MAG: signal peptide peptidase SppA [Psychromonas sp.]|nr:signal peptide peptidase SppA [Psychromonas sp.]
MKDVLNNMFRAINFIRLFTLNVLFFIIIIVLVMAFYGSEKPIKIAKDTTLQLNFTGEIVDQKHLFDLSAALSDHLNTTSSEKNQNQNQYQIDEILEVITHATHDNKINSILLDLSHLTRANLNQIADIGNALNKFKAAGKKVIAVSDNYSQIQYLLASYANKIYIAPQGMVFLPGYSVYRLYFKELLDKLLITPHIFKIGTYKSYVEPYTRKSMSHATRMANSHWLNQLWDNYIASVIAQRSSISNINSSAVAPSLFQLSIAFKKAKGDSAVYAQQVGLIDEIDSRLKIITHLKKEAIKKGKKFTLLTYDAYRSTLPKLYANKKYQNKVAVIYASGEILSGKQPPGIIGGETLSALLQKALEDTNIKAVVLRINSPGGSAFSSEKIRQQILALKSAHKKVVVSMGGFAASGGYWIASAADYIYASPTTLTGSIGIFGMYASVDKALKKIGIYNDGVGTSPLSGLSLTRPLNPELSNILQMGIDAGYKRFLQVVADGRHMSISQVQKVAEGRVWTGKDAVELGLVDRIGNLSDAINKAGNLAKLNNKFDVTQIKTKISTNQQILNELFSSTAKYMPHSNTSSMIEMLVNHLGGLYEQSSIISRFNDPKGQYIYCAMCAIN